MKIKDIKNDGKAFYIYKSIIKHDDDMFFYVDENSECFPILYTAPIIYRVLSNDIIIQGSGLLIDYDNKIVYREKNPKNKIEKVETLEEKVFLLTKVIVVS